MQERDHGREGRYAVEKEEGFTGLLVWILRMGMDGPCDSDQHTELAMFAADRPPFVITPSDIRPVCPVRHPPIEHSSGSQIILSFGRAFSYL